MAWRRGTPSGWPDPSSAWCCQVGSCRSRSTALKTRSLARPRSYCLFSPKPTGLLNP
jgi:hypothetical protein